MQREDVDLVPLGELHAASMFRWMLDPVVAFNIGLSRQPSYERTLEWLSAARADPRTCALAICWRQEHVGNVVLDHIDRELGSARLSIYIGEAAARGRGVGRLAVRLAAIHAFESIGVVQIWLTVHARNTVAMRAYKAVGFVVSDIEEGAFNLNDEQIDAIRMTLTLSELR